MSSHHYEKFFSENLRPRTHFTPARNWINDPNGLVYYKGKYHLFFQHNPEGILWGNMSWGHSVSTDLLHWEHLPVAIPCEATNGIFSGSAVVDYTNSTGFGTTDNPAMVAIYTVHQNDASNQSQHIAYSTDEGLTWTKYSNNPVLDLGMIDFRDPKVSWDESTQTWLMTVAKPQEFKIAFFRSPDLKTWTHLSDFGPLGATGGCWECPDLFSLTTTTGETKWVLLVSLNPGGIAGGSGTQYFIGDWDGKTFTTPQTETLWIDYGRDNYAGVTFANVADSRRIFLGWMSNWDYAAKLPSQIWRGSMTSARDLTLKDVSGKTMLLSTPITDAPLKSFDVDASKNFTLTITAPESGDNNCVISFDAATKKITITRTWIEDIEDFPADGPQVSSVISADHFTIQILLDNGSCELFVPEVALAMTSLMLVAVESAHFTTT